MKSKPQELKVQSPNYLMMLTVVSTVLISVCGIALVLSAYFGVESVANPLERLVHIPFWLMLGSIGVLLNYLPIAKSKPKVIPMIGIAMSLVTVIWFCVNNFFAVDDFSAFVDRLQIDLILLVICYCLTHLSLMTLTYRERQDNSLLYVTGAVIAASGIAYVVLFSGVLDAELFILTFAFTSCIFFAKFAMTIAQVIVSLNRSKESYPPSASYPPTSAPIEPSGTPERYTIN